MKITAGANDPSFGDGSNQARTMACARTAIQAALLKERAPENSSARKETQMCFDMQVRIAAAMSGVVHLFARRQIRRRRRLMRSRRRVARNDRLAGSLGASGEARDNGGRHKKTQ